MRFITLALAAGIGWAVYTLYQQDRRFGRSVDRMRERQAPARPAQQAPASELPAEEAVKEALAHPHPETPIAQAMAAAVEDKRG